MKKPSIHRTLDDFRADLERDNKTVAEWAREKKLHLDRVYAVLRGRVNGSRGHSREILLAMNVQPPPMFPAHAKRRGIQPGARLT